MRKFVIGLIVLGALLALYMGYARIGGTPPAGLSVPEPLPMPVANTAEEPNAQGGKIGDTEVVTVKQTRFSHRDENGRRDREFGFEVFLHKQGDRWRFTNPYMKLFLPKLQCHVTADAGEVQVQSAFGQLVPNDALFQGNVVIHIVPPKRNDPRECLIYLDDVTFVAEKSLFSSTGPVRFVSRSAVLEGVGMELIYDSLQSRLELFRIIKLTSLRIRSADIARFSGDKETAGRERRGTSGPGVEGGSPSDRVRDVRDTAGAAPASYECVLRGDVTIDTPQRLVIAQDLLSITDIPWVQSGEGEQAGDRGATKPSEPNTSEPPAPEPLDTKPPRQITFDAAPADSFDIVVTCSGGLVVAPLGMSSRYADPNAAVRLWGGASPLLDVQSNRQQVIARRIGYNWTTGDAAFIGPVQMAAPLDPNNLAGLVQAQAGPDRASGKPVRASRGQPIPVMITAQDAVHYTSALNRVVFEGDCTASAETKDPNIAHTFRLSAPTFAFDLMEDANAPASKKAVGEAITLKRFWTDGGQASIDVRRTAGRLHPAGEGRPLGWTQVLASQLEYAAKLFIARGPGELRLNNAQASSLDPNLGEPLPARASLQGVRDKPRQIDPNTFNLNQPCYAFLRDFDLLTFASDTNHIVVAAESQPILIDYFPLINGKYGQHIKGDAGHLDLTLRQGTGRMELASLIASKGITYEDQATQFRGGTFTYERDKSLIKVVGDETQPCYYNGALVDQIEIDTATGVLKANPRDPTAIQGKR